jgi:DNA-binding MarR family transcriptional regulator
MSKIPGKKNAYQGRPTQILIRLADHGPLMPNELVEMLGMTRPNTCTYLTRLKEAGFVEMTIDRDDRRKHYYSLTAEGRGHLDSWPAKSDGGRYAGKSFVKKKPKPIAYSEKESIDDLLNDCDEILYSGKNDA